MNKIIRHGIIVLMLGGSAVSPNLALVQEFAVKPVLGDLKDNRTTGQFFAGFEAEIKLVGDDLSQVKSVRTVLKSAVDETGRDLLKKGDDEEKPSFESLDDFGHQDNKITLKLKNPARKAAVIREITGHLDLLCPSRDPDSQLVIDKVLSQVGKPLAHPSLAAAGIEWTIYDKASYEAEVALRQAEAKKKMEEKDVAGKIGGAMVEAFSQFFSGLGNLGDNDIAIRVNDPAQKLAAYEFQDATGKKLKSNSRMTMGGNIHVIRYETKPQPDTRLQVTLATDKATVVVPLAFRDIVLP